MSNLLEIASLAWQQLYPNPTDETAVSREEFITTAKVQYPLMMWVQARNTKNQDGEFEVPTNILAQSEPLSIVDNEMDISSLKILRGLPNEMWLVNLGGLTCECQYVKTTANKASIFCDVEDGLSDLTKTYLVVGDRVIFPKGTHADKLPILYASNGIENDGMYEVDDVVGAMIQDKLIQIYGGKTGQEDTNNNGNPN